MLQGSSNFLEIVQVIETFGKEHWKKNHLACINNKLAKLINAWNTGGSCEEVCRLLDAMTRNAAGRARSTRRTTGASASRSLT